MSIGDAAATSAKVIPDIRWLKKLLDPFFSFELEIIDSENVKD